MTQIEVHSFVECSARRHLGVGKVVSLSVHSAVIEYFQSVGSDGRLLFEVAQASLRPADLPTGTRCFFRRDTRWHAGRLRRVDDQSCLIDLDGGDRASVDARDVFVRCRSTQHDPFGALEAGVLQDPSHGAARWEFVRAQIRQRSASRGMTGLISARIRLFPHQVEIASRILRDSTQRYLLADEVGLGKTIEAGIVLRQYQLDDPEGSAVVLAPRLLLAQWDAELTLKLGVDMKRVRLLPHGELGWWKSGPRIVIVDEAHHLASGYQSGDSAKERRYDDLRQAAVTVDRLLLLSATPLLHNEENFLAMLHLIDPSLYPLDQVDAFRARVDARREFALAFQGFTESSEDFFLEEHAETFARLFPEDERLAGALSRLTAAIESGNAEAQRQLVRTTRIHLGETYRLHERVLRTRRDSPLASIFPVRGRQRPDAVRGPEELDRRIAGWLPYWFGRLVADSDGDVPRPLHTVALGMLSRAAADPDVLAAYVRHRRDPNPRDADRAELSISELHANAIHRPTDLEDEILADLEKELHSSGLVDEWVRDVASQIVAVPPGAVIFCGYAVAAVRLADEIDGLLKGSVVARYFAKRDLSHLETDVTAFRRGRAPYLVCDSAGEEGRNLQFATGAVHLDLSWSPNRLEQRIGRLDRHGSGGAVPNWVITPRAGVLRDWLQVLIDGFGVFDTSIASLQHIVDSIVRDAIAHMFVTGMDSLASWSRDLPQRVAQERSSIEQIENLESIEAEHVLGRGLMSALSEVESDWSGLESSTERWLGHSKGFPGGLGLAINGDADRMSIRSYAVTSRRNTALPEEVIRLELGPLLGQKVTFNRATACDLGLPLMRPGEPLYDLIGRLTRLEDLGQLASFWRRDPSSDEEVIVFGVTYILECDPTPAASALHAAGVGLQRRESLHRLADAFLPPQAHTTWVGVDGLPVTQRLSERLAAGYSSTRGDVPLGPGHFPWLARLTGDAWADTCDIVRDHTSGQVAQRLGVDQLLIDAEASCRNAFDLASELQTLRSAAETDDRHRVRYQRELDELQLVRDELAVAIRQAVARPDSITVVVLSSERPE